LRRAELPDRATRILLRFWQRIANKLACRIKQRISICAVRMFLASIGTLQAPADMLARCSSGHVRCGLFKRRQFESEAILLGIGWDFLPSADAWSTRSQSGGGFNVTPLKQTADCDRLTTIGGSTRRCNLGQRQVDVFIPRSGFHRCDLGLSPHGQAGRGCGPAHSGQRLRRCNPSAARY